MTGRRALRPTLREGMLAAVLLSWSLAEALFSDEQPAPTTIRVVAALVPPVAVAFSRVWPEAAAGSVVCVFVLESLQPSPSGTLAAGFAWLAVAFGLAAWSRRPWPWLLALFVAGTMRDLRALDFETTDVMIDWAFIGFTVWVGRIVHHRTAQARALTTRLEHAEAERGDRARQAVTRERAVIARELHDIVAHSVSLMVVQAGTARPMAQRVDAELATVLKNIEDSGREALTELRRLLHVLRSAEDPGPAPLPDLGSLPALIDGVRRAGVDVRADLHLPDDVAPGVALCAYRTVQEGLTNAMRHADGARVDIAVAGDDRTLHVSVHDTGGDAKPSDGGTGTGLVGLRERVLLCGGRITAGPDGSGFLLDVTLPLSNQVVPAVAAPSPDNEEDP